MLMTGFTEEAIEAGIPLLKKPFAASTLVGQVERVLAESRRRTEDLRISCRKLRSQFEANLATSARSGSRHRAGAPRP